MPQEDRDALRDHLNEMFESSTDGLGDSLFGTAEEFKAQVSELNEDLAEDLAYELIEQDVIFIDTLKENIEVFASSNTE